MGVRGDHQTTFAGRNEGVAMLGLGLWSLLARMRERALALAKPLAA